MPEDQAQERIEAIWAQLDALAAEVGQADIVARLTADNRRLMLKYTDIYRQKAELRAGAAARQH